MIAEAGATEVIGGFIAPGEGMVETCVPEKGEHRVLDFFILGPGAGKLPKRWRWFWTPPSPLTGPSGPPSRETLRSRK
eukprot:16436969-Heterocapsa_arctica.AAC.1